MTACTHPVRGKSPHCRECCRTFTGDTAFDAHRAGPHDPDGLRYCIDVTTTEPWRETSRGWTNSAPMTDAQIARAARGSSDRAPNTPTPVSQVPPDIPTPPRAAR